MKKNKVVRVMTSGGLSSLGYAPAMRLRNAIDRENKDGWYVRQIINDDTSNFFLSILRGLLLVLTLFIWCPASSFIVVFEKSDSLNGNANVSQPAQINCPICNEQLAQGQKYCTNCGHEIK